MGVRPDWQFKVRCVSRLYWEGNLVYTNETGSQRTKLLSGFTQGSVRRKAKRFIKHWHNNWNAEWKEVPIESLS